MEKELANHILDFEERLFRLNTTEVRKLAYEFAEKAGLDHIFDETNQIAIWDWLKRFREPNPNISLKAPEPTSAVRASSFNKPQVMRFLALLEKTVTDESIPAHRIYNMDKSALGIVQKAAKISGRAYKYAATVRNARSTFKKSGIYPFNSHMFPKELFLPSEVTEDDIEMNEGQLVVAGVPKNIVQNVERPSSSSIILTGRGHIQTSSQASFDLMPTLKFKLCLHFLKRRHLLPRRGCYRIYHHYQKLPLWGKPE
ncbi:hypothetical protein ILUMI_04594 [Ignelater luminosus]|uniref:HTH CENPB-type domain-containing protein n=1 Tax=Ignelater luminosus TaxID=2038154 RepID=A0A8K0GEE3_IGNLU|nr:hypothetical protein ILUMI_04594 [Ignelater luminosus]